MNCPRCGLINPEIAQRCDCGYDFISKSVQESYLTSTPITSPSKIAFGAQLVALVLAGAAVIWGCCMIYVALYPRTSGEFADFSVLFAAMVDIPVGLVSLVVGLAVKKVPPVLRWTCIVLSVAALAMPFLIKAAWQRGKEIFSGIHQSGCNVATITDYENVSLMRATHTCDPSSHDQDVRTTITFKREICPKPKTPFTTNRP